MAGAARFEGLTRRPRLAILDEPDSGIDILALDNIVQLIQKRYQE